MQKNIFTILVSFSGVIIVISLGTAIGYRTNTIPKLKQDVRDERQAKERVIREKDEHIQQLEDKLTLLLDEQRSIKEKIQTKLTKEDKLALKKAKVAQEAKVAAEKKALAEVEAARKAAKKKKASKKSKAS